MALKAYLFTTGTLFALIGLTHLARLVQRLPTPEWAFDGILGGVSLCLALWAFGLTASARRDGRHSP